MDAAHRRERVGPGLKLDEARRIAVDIAKLTALCGNEKGKGPYFRSWGLICYPHRRDAGGRHKMETIKYKGYQIEIGSVGKGWRASILAPGSNRALSNSPSNLEKSTSQEITTEAKRIIDTLVSSQAES